MASLRKIVSDPKYVRRFVYNVTNANDKILFTLVVLKIFCQILNQFMVKKSTIVTNFKRCCFVRVILQTHSQEWTSKQQDTKSKSPF